MVIIEELAPTPLNAFIRIDYVVNIAARPHIAYDCYAFWSTKGTQSRVQEDWGRPRSFRDLHDWWPKSSRDLTDPALEVRASLVLDVA